MGGEPRQRTFEVKLTPEGTGSGETATLGRMSIDKRFQGALEATSKGEMLTAGTAVEGSAGYVAIERVSGTLHGRRGIFVLQHSGTMARGARRLTITVVPDSGTDQRGSQARCRSRSRTASIPTTSSTRLPAPLEGCSPPARKQGAANHRAFAARDPSRSSR